MQIKLPKQREAQPLGICAYTQNVVDKFKGNIGSRQANRLK